MYKTIHLKGWFYTLKKDCEEEIKICIILFLDLLLNLFYGL